MVNQSWTFHDRIACSCSSQQSVMKALESLLLGKNIVKWQNTSCAKPDHTFASHCGLANTWMNLPQRDLSSCKLQNAWFDSYSVSSLHYLQHYEPANLSDIVVLMYFGPAHKPQWSSQQTEQMFAVTTSCDCVWQAVQTNLKTNQQIQFLLFYSHSSPDSVDTNSVKLSFSAEVETVSTYLLSKPGLMVSLGVWRMLVHPYSDIQSLFWWGHSDLDIFLSINYINKPIEC